MLPLHAPHDRTRSRRRTVGDRRASRARAWLAGAMCGLLVGCGTMRGGAADSTIDQYPAAELFATATPTSPASPSSENAVPSPPVDDAVASERRMAARPRANVSPLNDPPSDIEAPSGREQDAPGLVEDAAAAEGVAANGAHHRGRQVEAREVGDVHRPRPADAPSAEPRARAVSPPPGESGPLITPGPARSRRELGQRFADMADEPPTRTWRSSVVAPAASDPFELPHVRGETRPTAVTTDESPRSEGGIRPRMPLSEEGWRPTRRPDTNDKFTTGPIITPRPER